ncbi:MAG TPA: hypothetical protein VMI54_23840 [Polyangiaceae bacterium]|nr:hypothetical protein [Polyangiaceae bacterium]
MTFPAVDQLTISRSIQAGGFFRRVRPLGKAAKEWLHFCVITPEVRVVLNFSLSRGVDEGSGVARLICVLRDETGCNGDVVTLAPEDVSIRAGKLDAQFGDSNVRFEDGRFRLRACIPRRNLELDLELVPRTLPMIVQNIQAGVGAALHWFLVPRLLATGRVVSNGREHRVEGAPAYHDHNWGTFRWGGEFSWTWGYGLPLDASVPWSFIMDHFMNRAGTRTRARALLIWKGPLHHRMFRDRSLEVEQHGLLRPERVFRVPRALAFGCPDALCGVPERVILRGASGDDRVEVEMKCGEVSQILVPSEEDEGLTLINEVECETHLHGVVAGERVEMKGAGMLEHLGHWHAR